MVSIAFGSGMIVAATLTLCVLLSGSYLSLGATMGSLLKSKLMAMISPESDKMAPVAVLNVPMILPNPSFTVMLVGAMI